jgi:hypothetical protein
LFDYQPPGKHFIYCQEYVIQDQLLHSKVPKNVQPYLSAPLPAYQPILSVQSPLVFPDQLLYFGPGNRKEAIL